MTARTRATKQRVSSVGGSVRRGVRDHWLRVAAARPTLIAASLTIGLYGVLSAAEPEATAPAVEAVRLGVDAAGQTRIVLDMDARPDFAVTPEGTERLLVRVAGARFAADAAPGATGVVRSVRTAPQRLTVTLASPALPVRSFVLPPAGDVDHWRLVIDLDTVDAATFAAAVPAAPGRDADAQPAVLVAAAAPSSASVADLIPPSPSLKPTTPTAEPAAEPAARPARTARAARRERVVVIDPGHGGHDPGASGQGAMTEEDANLAAALALRTILTARGYAVELTREDDSYVGLAERIERARAASADLFLSLHADGLEDEDVRGASVYTLSEERAGTMARELRGEGDFAVYQVSLDEEERDVGDILFDLASTTTRNESARFASLLVAELDGEVPMLRNSHRKKSLRVLLSPDVPAVLLEMGFMSNPQDEANLSSARWRRRAMGAVADGIDAYFAERVAAVPQDQTGG